MSALKKPPMIRPNESDDDYDQRLRDAGISPEDFDAWFESVFPVSGDSFSQSSFDDEDSDNDSDDSDDAKATK
jgi:hypothetical protein